MVDVLLTASWLWAVAVSGLPFCSGSSSPLYLLGETHCRRRSVLFLKQLSERTCPFFRIKCQNLLLRDSADSFFWPERLIPLTWWPFVLPILFDAVLLWDSYMSLTLQRGHTSGSDIWAPISGPPAAPGCSLHSMKYHRASGNWTWMCLLWTRFGNKTEIPESQMFAARNISE